MPPLSFMLVWQWPNHDTHPIDGCAAAQGGEEKSTALGTEEMLFSPDTGMLSFISLCAFSLLYFWHLGNKRKSCILGAKWHW